VAFSEPVSVFSNSDVVVSGTAGATTVTVTGSGATYNAAVGGMNGAGTVIATVPAGVASDATGNSNTASISMDNTVNYQLADTTRPAVTIDQATGQADPTTASPINFTAAFSEPVTGFTSGDVTLSGTAPGTKTATVTGSGATYNMSITGMTGSGTVAVAIAAGIAIDGASNTNTASDSTDNTVTYNHTASTTVRLQENSSSVAYTGTWYRIARALADGGYAKVASGTGATATVTFVGTGISWIGFRGQSGVAEVYLDGVLRGTIDTYSASDVYKAFLFQLSGLARSTHRLTVKVLGRRNSSSTASWIWVDAFDVTP
jgi:hypothetical protein